MSGIPVQLQPPGLVYQIAFDRCVTLAQPQQNPALLLASNPFYARELLRRWSSPVIFCPIGGWMPPGYLMDVLGQDIDLTKVQVMTEEELFFPSTTQTIIWAEPAGFDWRKQLTWLLDKTGGNCQLYILGRTIRLQRFLPNLPHIPAAPVNLAGFPDLVDTISEHGLNWAAHGFQAPWNLLAGIGNRILTTGRRDDLVDRLLAWMRHNFTTQGRYARYSPVWLLVAQPKRAIHIEYTTR